MTSYLDRLPNDIQENINEIATIRNNYDKLVQFINNHFVWQSFQLKTLQQDYYMQSSKFYIINPDVLNNAYGPDVTEYHYVESVYSVPHFQYGNNTLEVTLKKASELGEKIHTFIEDKPDGTININQYATSILSYP